METLFSSSNQELHNALTAGEPEIPLTAPCRRIRQKQSSTVSGLGMSASSIGSLTLLMTDASVSPKSFKDLNIVLKQKGKEKGKSMK